jgi:D-tagatose-1,6-bisphosphate aldolase subunit GatZ/KbaZ
MKNLNEIIKDLISLRELGRPPITMLAVCPNSSAVLEAAVSAAAEHRSVMLFAATLNQVDYEASYTGWTPAEFVHQMQVYAHHYQWSGPLYPCLDHGGPWLKDLHSLANLPYSETMQKVKTSLTACVLAGYQLLHIDPTIDRTLPGDLPIPLERVVGRTVELIEHAERVRSTQGLPGIAYEVGTEEVHGGLVDIGRFEEFIRRLKAELERKRLSQCWPCLLVAQVGTDLHTTTFDAQAARCVFGILSKLGSLAKGHYTDWVETPEDYPASGMGAANVGPEFTAQEFTALNELDGWEKVKGKQDPPSNFMHILQEVVVESGRWKKWLLPEEKGLDFDGLEPSRRNWLLKTGSRYIWTDPRVIAGRNTLYRNLSEMGINAHAHVLSRISQAIEKYIRAFNLENSLDVLGL